MKLASCPDRMGVTAKRCCQEKSREHNAERLLPRFERYPQLRKAPMDGCALSKLSMHPRVARYARRGMAGAGHQHATGGHHLPRNLLRVSAHRVEHQIDVARCAGGALSLVLALLWPAFTDAPV